MKTLAIWCAIQYAYIQNIITLHIHVFLHPSTFLFAKRLNLYIIKNRLGRRSPPPSWRRSRRPCFRFESPCFVPFNSPLQQLVWRIYHYLQGFLKNIPGGLFGISEPSTVVFVCPCFWGDSSNIMGNSGWLRMLRTNFLALDNNIIPSIEGNVICIYIYIYIYQPGFSPPTLQ